MAQIKVDNLTVYYGSNPVIENLSFSVSEGDFLCIIGENGSGKSTLVKTLLGQKQPKSGTVTYGDGLLQTQIGYLPQQSPRRGDFPATAWEVVLSGALDAHRLFLSPSEQRLAAENMELLGISDLKNKSISRLSGGQRQRVMLARALCATKKLILLDEPTAALDPEATEDFYSLIVKINRTKKITVIMVSHDMGSIKYATHILHMGDKNEFMTRGEFLGR